MSAGTFRAAAALIVVGAAALRVPALWQQAWLDEIWNWSIARGLRSPLEVLTAPQARVDGNHPLYTFVIWALGETGWIVRRLPALLCGLATVPVAMAIMARRGRVEALAAGLAFAVSYPFVHYSAEARGYAPVVLLALLAFVALERDLDRDGRGWPIGFWVTGILGIVAHLLFVELLAGAGAWFLVHAIRRRRALGAIALGALRLFGPIAAFLALWAVVFLVGLGVGDAPRGEAGAALAALLPLVLGAPAAGWPAVLASVLALALFAAALIALGRRGDERAFAFGAIVVLGGGLVLAGNPSGVLYPRYLLIPGAFVLLALAGAAPALLRRAPVVAVAAVALFCAGNLWRDVRWLRTGRGDYRGALAYMAAHTPGAAVTLVGDNALATRHLVAEHGGAAGKPVEIRRLRDWPAWILLGDERLEPAAPPATPHDEYAFDRSFSHYGLSGCTWHLYRRR